MWRQLPLPEKAFGFVKPDRLNNRRPHTPPLPLCTLERLGMGRGHL